MRIIFDIHPNDYESNKIYTDTDSVFMNVSTRNKVDRSTNINDFLMK